jgi:hypothetical protein
MQYQSIRVVHAEQFDSATAQTSGSKRTAAVYPGAGIRSPMWGGLFFVEPGAHTGIHHHGLKPSRGWFTSAVNGWKSEQP